MTWQAIVATYFVTWWIVLFAVLPFWTHTQDDAGEVTLGTSGSAPARLHLWKTALATSIVAAVVVGLIWLAFGYYGISLETFAGWIDFRQ